MLSLLTPILILLISIQFHGYAAAEFGADFTPGKPLRIGVPADAFSKVFVKIYRDESSHEEVYSGFCIRVFEEVLKLSRYDIRYKFVEFHGSYDDLVSSVANKTFDAAVGDITIMSYRYTMVEFTEPFTESGLSLVVQTKPAQGVIFLRPFTLKLWIATGGILVYTMFVVWFIEHRSNPEFNGPWRDQLGIAMWFTFSSLFFAQKEGINRTHTRVVVVVWLFVVLILTQSYTASLTSMLTFTRLHPNIESLRRGDAKIGCDDNSFMSKFVENSLGFRPENIKPLVNDEDYLRAFRNGSISAAFLEIPYAKVFVNTHCKEFTVTNSSFRFGGLAFVFQKGSPVAKNFSEAILKLSENGMLKRLEETWLTSSSECSESKAASSTDSLSLWSFWILYLFSVATSTLCLTLFVVRLLRDYPRYRPPQGGNASENAWSKVVGVVRYLKSAEPRDRGLAPGSSKVVPKSEMLGGPDHAI